MSDLFYLFSHQSLPKSIPHTLTQMETFMLGFSMSHPVYIQNVFAMISHTVWTFMQKMVGVKYTPNTFNISAQFFMPLSKCGYEIQITLKLSFVCHLDVSIIKFKQLSEPFGSFLNSLRCTYGFHQVVTVHPINSIM